MLRTSVPEAAVDEDGDATLGESEVRPAGQIDLSSPTGQSAISEEPHNNGLCGFVAAPSNLPHDSRAFRAVNGVDHWGIQVR